MYACGDEGATTTRASKRRRRERTMGGTEGARSWGQGAQVDYWARRELSARYEIDYISLYSKRSMDARVKMDDGRSGAARVHVECSSLSHANSVNTRARTETRFTHESRRRSEECATHRARAWRGACRACERTGAAGGMPLFRGTRDAVVSRAMAYEE
jgi:hypothetical protein